MLSGKQDAIMQLESILTCPKCSHQAVETMPTDACQFFYDCKGCGQRLKPLVGDCCVFCSYGSVPCPPIQGAGNCCAQETH
jgi:transcription elongation factor Elf1